MLVASDPQPTKEMSMNNEAFKAWLDAMPIDDVRRKIQESNEKPAEKSEELASRSRQQQPVTPAPEAATPKQEPAK